jgi:hypothetical protein
MSTTDHRTKAEKAAAERFPRDTANHQMTVLFENGLYRHLRFDAPDGSGYRFDLVTWPNRLAFQGEPGGHVRPVPPVVGRRPAELRLLAREADRLG